jgi:hypothetical protein
MMISTMIDCVKLRQWKYISYGGCMEINKNTNLVD